MKTKLTLNIEDSVVAKAKKISVRKRKSLSALIEEYLDSLDAPRNGKKPFRSSITGRIRKLTRKVKLPLQETKKQWRKHLDTKYGR
jgi:hypothetical protein